jgi:hypothetical protein
MNKWMKRGITIGLFLVAWRFVSSFCSTQTEGFSLLRIHPDFAFVPIEPPAPCKELPAAILSQPFYYLARGGQCFAFISEDGKVVIKFLHHHIYKPYSFLFKIPMPLSLKRLVQKRLNKQLSKVKKERASYKLAYEELQEESGLLCVHWGDPTPGGSKIVLVDKLGIKHCLDLNGVEFVVQKRIEPLSCVLDRLSNEEELKLAIRGVVDLVVRCAQKGIFDEDPGLHRNIGFEGKTPLLIDMGKLVKDLPKATKYKDQLPLMTTRFRSFLETSYPNLVSILDEEVLAACSSD